MAVCWVIEKSWIVAGSGKVTKLGGKKIRGTSDWGVQHWEIQNYYVDQLRIVDDESTSWTRCQKGWLRYWITPRWLCVIGVELAREDIWSHHRAQWFNILGKQEWTMNWPLWSSCSETVSELMNLNHSHSQICPVDMMESRLEQSSPCLSLWTLNMKICWFAGQKAAGDEDRGQRVLLGFV